MSITIIPQQQLKCDYYIQNMLDLPLRLAYEALRFADEAGARSILHEKDVIDARLFLSSELPALISAYEDLLAVSQNMLPDRLNTNYSELLKLYAMHCVAKAAHKVHRRFELVNRKPWDTPRASYESAQSSLNIKECYGGTDLDVYDYCTVYTEALNRYVGAFRDYSPCWEYQEQSVELFTELSGTLNYCGKSPYAPHAEADVDKYNGIKNSLLPLINSSIKLHNTETVVQSDYVREIAGKFVIYCNEYGTGEPFRESAWYFSPLAVAETKAEARTMLKELTRPINIFSSCPYYPQVRCGECDKNGKVQYFYTDDDYM